MNASPTNDPGRILVIGRSPSVLVDTVEILRSKGYSADATNQFDRVLNDYDVEGINIIVFGGMVPADTKQRLRQEICERNAQVTFVQGLAGIAGLIAAQVEGMICCAPPALPQPWAVHWSPVRRRTQVRAPLLRPGGHSVIRRRVRHQYRMHTSDAADVITLRHRVIGSSAPGALPADRRGRRLHHPAPEERAW